MMLINSVIEAGLKIEKEKAIYLFENMKNRSHLNNNDLQTNTTNEKKKAIDRNMKPTQAW